MGRSSIGRRVFQTPLFQHRFDAGLASQPRLVHRSQILGVAPGKYHAAKAVAVGSREAAVVQEPLLGIVIEHLAP